MDQSDQWSVGRSVGRSISCPTYTCTRGSGALEGSKRKRGTLHGRASKHPRPCERAPEHPSIQGRPTTGIRADSLTCRAPPRRPRWPCPVPPRPPCPPLAAKEQETLLSSPFVLVIRERWGCVSVRLMNDWGGRRRGLNPARFLGDWNPTRRPCRRVLNEREEAHRTQQQDNDGGKESYIVPVRPALFSADTRESRSIPGGRTPSLPKQPISNLRRGPWAE